MPIEIKELIIRAVVSDKEKTGEKTTVSSEDLARIKKELVKEITEKVLYILQQKNER